MQRAEKTIGPDPIEEKGWIYPTESTKPIASAPDEFQSSPYRTLQVSTIKGTPEAESTRVPIATSTVEKVGKPTQLERTDKVVAREEPEQQDEDDQWVFTKDEVEKMREARELAQKEQQKLKQEQEKVEKQRAKLEAEGNQRLQEQREKTQDSILRAKRGLEELQSKITSVSKMTQEQKRDQSNGITQSIEPLEKATEEIPKAKDHVVGLTSYPSSESLHEFELKEIDSGQYWYYAVKAEQIKKKMDQATKAFHTKDEYYRDPKLYDSFYAEYARHIEKFQKQLESINEILATHKTETGIYEYPSSPSLVLHLGELDDQPREYFERTKREVAHKNTLAKRVYAHKMQNVTTSDDENQVSQEYQRFKRKQSRILSICEKKMQQIGEPDYLQLREAGYASDSDLEEEIKVQHEELIGGNTIPPLYSKEISRYQPSNKERTKAMKDALNAVREFTSEENLNKNGNINTTTMKEMWDYEDGKPSPSRDKGVTDLTLRDPKNVQMAPKVQCELCGGNHANEQCPHANIFSQIGRNTSRSKVRGRFPKGKSRSIDYYRPLRKRPSPWRPAHSVNERLGSRGPQNTESQLTIENLSDLAPEKLELEMG